MAQDQDIGTESPAGLNGEVAGPVVLSMPARAEYVALSRLAMAALANRFGLDHETLADLKLAVTEACSLFVGHPEEGLPASDVRVEFDPSGDVWSISVSGAMAKEGPPVADDPAALALVVIEALTDEVETHRDGSRVWLRFSKSVR